MLNLSESKAQGLSLTFNLTENDNLASMIAESKKYEISSLTLSGYVNEENTKYIKDLNAKGRLLSLDLSGVKQISTYYRNQNSYIFNHQYLPPLWKNSKVGEMYSFIKQYGFTDIPGKCPYSGHDDINTDKSVSINIIEEHHDNMCKITLVADYTCPYGDHVSGSNVIYRSFFISYPQLLFQDNSFTKLVLPNNIGMIGHSDCRFRVKGCNELVLGKQITTIGENAFKGSHIGTITFNSPINEILANAFENATGNCFANSQLLESVKYIGDNAFKNSKLLEDANGSATLQVEKIGKNAFYNAVIPNNLSLPKVDEIGDSTFMFSTIAQIDMGSNIYKLGNSTFENCTALHTFKGGQTIEQIGKRAFYGCTKLSAFTPSNILRTIGNEAFAKATALYSFIVPNATNYIGYGAFSYSGLRDFDWGKYEKYRRDIVNGCDRLETVKVSSENNVLQSKNGVLMSKDGKKVLLYPCSKKDTLYSIINDVVELADSSFYHTSFLNTVVLPESISKIGKNAFGDSNISNIVVLSSTPPKVTENNSGLNQSKVNLYVYKKDYSTYYVANYWGDFKHIYTIEDNGWITYMHRLLKNNNDNVVKSMYDSKGQRILLPTKGVNIIRMSDGTVKKVIVK